MSGFGGGVASLSMKTAGGGGGIVTNNLVLHLDAGDSSSYSGSGTTWTDLSSSSNNGTLTNGPTFDSANGGSIVFDGTNDYVQFSSDTFNPNADFTISAWVNLDTATGTNNYTIISDVNFTGSIQLRYKNGTGVQIIDNNIVNVGTFASSSLSTTTWYNVTVTRSSNTYTLYLNGSSTSSFTSSNTYDGGARSIGINKYNSEKWDGKIAQVFAYSSTLTSSEVLQNYNATKSRYHAIITNNLVLHLDAGNSSSYSGSGTTWSDLSGSSNDGTLTNGVTYSSDNGGVLVFDGTDDYVVTGSDMFNSNADFTLSMWFNSDDFSVQRAFVADVDNSQSLFLRYNNGIQVVNSNTAILGSFSSSTLSTNTWYNITFTRSSNTYTFYLNGSSVSTVTTSQSFTHSPTTIGANHNTASPFYKNAFDGKIGQVFAYSTNLTASEVLQNFDATKVRYGL